MSLEDMLNSLSKRISNPILGNYLLTLAILNWRFFPLFVSGEETSKLRIEQIESYIETATFSDSFWQAAVVLAIYLYLIPYIIVLFKTIKSKVDVYVLRKEIEFDRKVENEKRIGGQIEVIATDLKFNLAELVNQFEHIIKFMDANWGNTNGSTLTDKNHLSKISREKIESATKLVTYNDDILRAQLSGDRFERNKKFQENRKNK